MHFDHLISVVLNFEFNLAQNQKSYVDEIIILENNYAIYEIVNFASKLIMGYTTIVVLLADTIDSTRIQKVIRKQINTLHNI